MPGIFYTLGLNANPLVAGLSAASGMLRGFIGAVGTITGLGGGIIGTTGAVMGLKKAFGEAANMETMNVAFEVLLGNAQTAQKMLGDLRDFAATTPMTFPGLAGGARTLLSFNVAASKILPTMKMLGDVSGGSEERFSQLALTYGQIASAGRLMGQDLLQLINAGFNPLQEISRKTGESMEALKTKMESGGISFAQVEEAFRSATGEGGRFFGMLERQGRTATGIVSTLQDNFNTLFREFGTPVNEALKPMLAEASKALEGMAPLAKQLGADFATALGAARELFQSGQMGEALSLSLQVGFGEAVNYGAGLLRGVLQAAGVTLAASLQSNLEGLKAMARPNYWIGISLSLAAAAQNFSAILLDGVAEVTRGMSRVKGFGFLNKSADLLDGGASKARENAGALKRDADTYMLETTDAFANIRKGLGSKFRDSFQESIKSMELVNLDGMKAKLTQMFVGAAKDAQAGIAGTLAADSEFNPLLGGAPSKAASSFEKSPAADKLSKAGIFIGGNGGPRGERAAEDTAKHTGTLVKLTEKLLAQTAQQPATAGATF